VIYKLLIRLQELNPAVGQYLLNKQTDIDTLVRTTNESIAIPDDILLRQFNDPASISQHEILNLFDGFKPRTS
jgi:hypothetical protein